MLMIMGVDIATRCNYVSTAEFLVLNKLVIDMIYFNLTNDQTKPSELMEALSTEFIEELKLAVWIVICIFSFLLVGIDVVLGGFNFYTRWTQHFDLFNFGVLAGKVLLIPMALYLNGVVLYQNQFELVLNAFRNVF